MNTFIYFLFNATWLHSVRATDTNRQICNKFILYVLQKKFEMIFVKIKS